MYIFSFLCDNMHELRLCVYPHASFQYTHFYVCNYLRAFVCFLLCINMHNDYVRLNAPMSTFMYVCMSISWMHRYAILHKIFSFSILFTEEGDVIIEQHKNDLSKYLTLIPTLEEAE